MSRSIQLPFFKETIDQNTFRILYYRNKNYLIPLALVLLGVFLIFFAVLPQIQDYFTLKEEEKITQEKIKTLKNNTAFLTTINETDLDKKLQAAAEALPAEKDFGGILQAIGQAARDADVTLGDFSFQIGSLSPGTTKVTNALPIEIALTVNSGLSGSKKFLHALTRRLPLSEVINLRAEEKSSNIGVIFYYKPIPPITFDGTRPIPQLTQDDVTLLNELSTFEKTQFLQQENVDSGISLPL